MHDAEDRPGLVKSDLTMFDIIEALHRLEVAGVTELADHVGISKGAVHKHLKTLEERECVVNEGGSYRLGFKFFSYGAGVRERNEMCKLLRSKVDQLAEKTGERISASIEEHGRGTFVYIRNDRLELQQTSSPGSRYYLHECASGKAMLAKLPDEEIEAIVDEHGLPQRTENVISDRTELFEAIERVRERNYALNVEEMRQGMNAVGVAVYHPEIDTLGALAVVGPSNRLTVENIEDQYVDDLLEVANELELQIKYG